MRIEVTQRDIDLGVPTSLQNCPIALALKNRFRRMGDTTPVGVNTLGFATLNIIGNWTDSTAYNFIHKFDLNEEVSPSILNYSEG